MGGDSLIGEDVLTEEDLARQGELKGDPLRGVHAFYAACEREWWAPLHADSRVRRRNALVAVLDKPSEFSRASRPRVDRPRLPGRRPAGSWPGSTG